MPTLAERIEGGLLGLLIGDAFGVPYEFNPPSRLPPKAALAMVPPHGFFRSHGSVPPGTWSDDGAHALCLLACLLQNDRLDLEDLGERIVAWYDQGYLAVDDKVFDVGIQTRSAISSLKHGVPAREAGPDEERSNGNGSLMRVLPLALWHQGTDGDLVTDAMEQSKVTHGHVRSQVCCALYVLWARRLLQDHPAAWDDAVAFLRARWGEETDARAELEFQVRPDDFIAGRGSGYVVDCLRSARWVMQEPSYEGVVRAAVSLGDDTDTTACVAGGVAGVRDGVQAIPAEWRAQLRGQALYQPLLEALLARFQRPPGK
jgi:ADP-ribosylglycohydrolase